MAASLAVVALVYGIRSYTTSAAPHQQPIAGLPSPVQEVVRERAAPPPSATPPARSTRGQGDWVVVAEIYKQHDQAMKRAQQIAARWRDWRPGGLSSQSRRRRFMVVLGFSENRKDAEQLLARARDAGMPRNVYLTRLKR